MYHFLITLELSCRITSCWAPLEMLTLYLQDHILSTTGDACLLAGSHTEHHWRCLLYLQDHILSTTGDVCFTYLQDHILSTTGDAYLLAGSHTEHHWRCLLYLLTYLLTYSLCLDPRNKRKDGWPGREERGGGPWDTEKCSVHWPGYATSYKERERERVLRAAAAWFEAWKAWGGGGAMGLSILLVAATRNPNGVQKCDEW